MNSGAVRRNRRRADDPITIRRYEDADASQIAQLFFDSVRSVGSRFYNSEQIGAWAPAPADSEAVQARAGDGRTTLVAVNSKGDIVCYGDLQADGHLDHLYCRPDVVGTGIASRLLDQLIAEAATQGIGRVFVEASEGARALFAQKGFALIGRHDFILRGVPIHNYRMEKLLL